MSSFPPVSRVIYKTGRIEQREVLWIGRDGSIQNRFFQTTIVPPWWRFWACPVSTPDAETNSERAAMLELAFKIEAGHYS